MVLICLSQHHLMALILGASLLSVQFYNIDLLYLLMFICSLYTNSLTSDMLWGVVYSTTMLVDSSDVQQVEEFSLCFSVKRKEVVDGSKLKGFPVRRVKVCCGGKTFDFAVVSSAVLALI